MPMTRKRVLLGLCAMAVPGNLALGAVALADLRRACPEGAHCADAWSSLLLFAGLGLAFAVVALLVWGGRIG